MRGTRALEPDTIAVRIVDLQVGMIIAKDLRTAEGMLVVAKGQEVSEQLISHLHNYWDEASFGSLVQVSLPPADDEAKAA